jgi:hypothetical protein
MSAPGRPKRSYRSPLGRRSTNERAGPSQALIPEPFGAKVHQ